MIYLVMYRDEYDGYFVDDEMRYFSVKDKAKQYANNLNRILAKANNCSIKELADKYEIIMVRG